MFIFLIYGRKWRSILSLRMLNSFNTIGLIKVFYCSFFVAFFLLRKGKSFVTMNLFTKLKYYGANNSCAMVDAESFCFMGFLLCNRRQGAVTIVEKAIQHIEIYIIIYVNIKIGGNIF